MSTVKAGLSGGTERVLAKSGLAAAQRAIATTILETVYRFIDGCGAERDQSGKRKQARFTFSGFDSRFSIWSLLDRSARRRTLQDNRSLRPRAFQCVRRQRIDGTRPVRRKPPRQQGRELRRSETAENVVGAPGKGVPRGLRIRSGVRTCERRAGPNRLSGRR